MEILESRIIPPQIIPLIQKAGQHHVPVLILGEQGVGKETVARAIHQAGEWKTYRFYKIDCKALKEGTFLQQLSLLFKEIRYGEIPATLFLKEVGYLSSLDQLKFLNLLEEGVFQLDALKKSVKNIRWISSSSKSLKEKVVQGKFLEDLLDRLSPLLIQVPPLRERIQDIPSIAHDLLSEYGRRMNVKKKGISEGVLSLLKSYWWPGNIKELEIVILRSAVFSEGDLLVEKDLFFHAEVGGDAFTTFLRRTEAKDSNPSNGQPPPHDQDLLHWILFLAELVHRVKNPLVSIKTFTQLLREKFNDGEYRDTFYRVVTEDIEKIDLVLNGLLNYIKMNSPLSKTNTVHQILDQVVEQCERMFAERKIKIFRKYEPDLPETMIQDEPLKYIFHSLIQYMLPVVPPQGSIGFLTKCVTPPKPSKEDASPSREGEYIEVLLIFSGYKKAVDSAKRVFGISTPVKEEAFDLELRLVYEILKKHQGTLRFEVNEKKPRTLISLRLPIERRKVYYYPSAMSQSERSLL